MSKNKLIPELRFPEFENEGEWEEKTLNELGYTINGLTYNPNDISEDGLLVLRSSNVQNGQIDLNDCIYVRPDIRGANLIKPDDILICIRNGSKALIGKNAIIPKDIPIATHGAFMTVYRAEYPKFVYQLFQTNVYYNQVNADLGATINSINGGNFLKYKFIVPNPKEQQKIASCLSSLDEVITAENQKLEALKDHKKGLMQNLFPQMSESRISTDEQMTQISENSNKKISEINMSESRISTDEQMTQISDNSNKKISEIPKSKQIRGSDNVPKYRFPEFENDGEWMEKKLGEIGEFLGGGTPSRLNSEYWTGNIPWISSSDINEDDIHNISISQYINENAIIESATKIIPKGSILFVSRVGVGKLAINCEELCTSQDFTSFIPTVVLNLFVAYYFSANKNSLLTLSQGTSIKGFSKSDLEDFKIPYPKNSKEQQKIASCLSSLDTLITAQAEKIEQLKLHKKGLMQGLFPKIND